MTTTTRNKPAAPRRFLGIPRGSWIVTGIVLALCVYIWQMHAPQTPNAFEDPGAQQPNRLRSLWGVDHPI